MYASFSAFSIVDIVLLCPFFFVVVVFAHALVALLTTIVSRGDWL